MPPKKATSPKQSKTPDHIDVQQLDSTEWYWSRLTESGIVVVADTTPYASKDAAFQAAHLANTDIPTLRTQA